MNGYGSQPKSRLAAVTFARELLCLNRAGSMLNIKSQWQDSEFFIYFFVIRVYYEKLGHVLKPLVSKFRSDLSARLRDIPRKTGPHEAETDSSLLCRHRITTFFLL